MEPYRLVISFIILKAFHVGHTLRCACKEDLRTCTSIHNMKVDFQTAQQICMEDGGKLLMPRSKTIDSLLFNKTGHFWMGTEGNCLNSSRNSRGNIDALNRGEGDVVCSSRCMSVSSKRTLTERPCEEKTDGFLCDGIQWENCWEDRAFEVQTLNKKGCKDFPCEHHCQEVPGGHMCSCYNSFRPRRIKWESCEIYCDSATCPLHCPPCECPDGFIKDETQCTDLDECLSNHNNCDQKCRNTFGGYKCSCYEGFMLVNKSKCVALINPTPLTAALVTPSVNYTLSKAAFATPAEFIGLILFIVLVISALIGLLYYLRKSKPDSSLKDDDAPEDTTVQEAQLQL